MRRVLNYLIPVLICFGVGFTASLFQSGAIKTWYPTLHKPILTPPNIAFPIAWSILYLFMGMAIGKIINVSRWRERSLIKLFILQLFFNFTWSITFFYMRNPLLGFINIVLLDILVIKFAIKCYPEYKISSFLFIPYIFWILFATYLNGYILINN